MSKRILFTTTTSPYTGSGGDKTINFQAENGIYFDLVGTSSMYVNNVPLSASAFGVILPGTGVNSTVRVANNNFTVGNYSGVLSGTDNTASGSYSFIAGGKNASADKYGQFSQAAGNFSTNGDAQASVLVARIVTTNNTPTELLLDGSISQIILDVDTTWGFNVDVVGARKDGSSAFFKLTGCIKNISGTTSIVGAVTKVVTAREIGSWDVNITADDLNDALVIKATGENSHIIRWVARIELVEVKRDTTGSI